VSEIKGSYTTLTIALLIAGLIIGAAIGYFAIPIKTVNVVGNFPVSPVYSPTIPNDMADVTVIRCDSTHMLYYWRVKYADGTEILKWSYSTIGIEGAKAP